MDTVQFQCPTCSSAVEDTGNGYRCAKCEKTYPIVDGVPRFLDRPIYWGELDEDEMNELVHNAEQTSWREAVEYLYKPNPVLHQYIADGGRARWRLVLGIDENTRVLDLGAGYGSLSVPVAKVAGQVVSVDAVPQRNKFLRIRAAQEGLDNVVVVNGDVMRPPLAPGQFDVVILNGMLEWVAVAETEGAPREVQLRFLRNVRSLLREGGKVYVGIENRFGHWAWAGGKDHSGLKYTSIMPKFMANWVVRAKAKRQSFRTDFSKDSYRTYIYSSYGFRKLLQEAGFANVGVYTPFPTYNHVNCFLSIDDPTPYRHFIRSQFRAASLKSRLLRGVLLALIPIGIHKVWSSSYGIVGYKKRADA
jgi:SAM-dependent methyltransferase